MNGKLYYNRIDYGDNNIWYRDNTKSLNKDKKELKEQNETINLKKKMLK